MFKFNIILVIIFYINPVQVTRCYPDFGIFYGTKWCGDGNISSSYDDLGKYAEVDACCRTHDHGDYIPAYSSKYGLSNNGPYCRMHCDDDMEFYKCLDSVTSYYETYVADTVGYIYFNVLGMYVECFKKEYPIVECAVYKTRKEDGKFFSRCVEYILDYTKPKIYQWFDLPYYVESWF